MGWFSQTHPTLIISCKWFPCVTPISYQSGPFLFGNAYSWDHDHLESCLDGSLGPISTYSYTNIPRQRPLPLWGYRVALRGAAGVGYLFQTKHLYFRGSSPCVRGLPILPWSGMFKGGSVKRHTYGPFLKGFKSGFLNFLWVRSWLFQDPQEQMILQRGQKSHYCRQN